MAVQPWSAVQTNKVNEAAEAGDLAVFSAKVMADGMFFAYASKVDNVTSDPIFVPDDLMAMDMQWIDGVAHSTGAGGTNADASGGDDPQLAIVD